MLDALLILTLIVLILYIYYYFVQKLKYWKNKEVQYADSIPILGSMLPLVTKRMSTSEFLQYLYNQYPQERYSGFFQFNKPVLILKDPELIRQVTVKNFESFVDHSSFIKAETDYFWSKSLFVTSGEKWRELRQTLTPVFTGSKMRMMFPLIEECAKDLIDYYKQHPVQGLKVDTRDLFLRYTNDVIATTAFGFKCNSFNNKDNEFLVAGREITDFTGLNKLKFMLGGQFPSLTKLFRVKIVSDHVGNFFRCIINETIAAREDKKIIRQDLIHLLLLARKGKLDHIDNTPETQFAVSSNKERSGRTKFLTNDDITAQAILFFLGGLEAPSTTMTFMAYELAINPDIQTRLRAEIQRTHDKTGNTLTYEALGEMKYMDMVVSESLRKWPQATFVDRLCTKSFTIERVGKPHLQINVGDTVWIPVYPIHRDPKYYPDPEKFDPERFNGDNKGDINLSAYLPFGNGPRNCIGNRFALMEMKIAFFYMLLNFEIVPDADTQIPVRLSKSSFTLQAENGIKVGLRSLSQDKDF